MCGITGIIRYNSVVKEAEITAMTEAIKHRGPDGEGIFSNNNIALGHRRLSIIDLKLGQQPMSINNEKLVITYNGEIYNYRELRQELLSLGHQFKTNSDTEVILTAYFQWKEKCLEKLRGMYAFCIADFEKNTLFLARDPLGIKPLIFWEHQDFFAFASELPALRKVNAPDPRGNINAIEEFLRLSYIPSPNTIYKDIYKLPPGHYVNVPFKGRINSPVKYWDFKFENSNNSSNIDWVNMSEEFLYESVKSHLVSDVPFGVFLSGGIDSTLVAGTMSKILDKKVTAFAIGFKDKDYDELKYAEKAAKTYDIELISETIDINETSIISELIQHHGEPFGDSSIIPTWHVCKLARKHVPMVLSGDGGDELFAGYNSHANWMNYSPRNYIKTQFYNKNYYSGIRGLLGYSRKAIKNSTTNFLDEWYPKFSYSTEELRNKLWNDDYKQLIHLKVSAFEEAHTIAKKMNRLDYAQYMDMHTNLSGHILSKVDTASMYHGLEVRPPILDIEMLKLASRIPKEKKFNNKNKTSPGKYNLKSLLGKDFEKDFVYREKQGFSIPKYKWFYKSNLGYELLWSFLNNPSNKLNMLFNTKVVLSLLRSHCKKEKDNSNFLWLLLILGIWFDNNEEINFSYS